MVTRRVSSSCPNLASEFHTRSKKAEAPSKHLGYSGRYISDFSSERGSRRCDRVEVGVVWRVPSQLDRDQVEDVVSGVGTRGDSLWLFYRVVHAMLIVQLEQRAGEAGASAGASVA